MTIDEAIKILERWHAGGFATRIEDMNPALLLGIEALKRLKDNRHYAPPQFPRLLPGETKD